MFDENGNYIGEENINYEKTIKKPKRKAGKIVLICCLSTLLACAVFVSSAFMASRVVKNFSVKESIGTTQDEVEKDTDRVENTYLNYSNLIDEVGEMSIENIVETCLPSVVSITNKGVSEIMTFFGNYQTESISSGSGIIIGQNDSELLIVTNYHVVADSKELSVVFSHEETQALTGDDSYINKATIKGYDSEKDIAVIAVKLKDIDTDTKSQIKIAAIGDSTDIKLGSGVVAIGNSLGHGQSVTHGIVSAVDREVKMQGINGGTITNKYIQTDAAINSGNSGGALLNMKGELIGINSAKISATGVEGMGYAIPITDVEELIGELMNAKTRDVVPEGERGYLGIYGSDVTSTAAETYDMPIGVFVKEKIENSPADRSDLQKGDIIVKLDETTITSMASLNERLSYYRAGETVTLTVKRPNGMSYSELTVDIKLASKKGAGIE